MAGRSPAAAPGGLFSASNAFRQEVPRVAVPAPAAPLPPGVAPAAAPLPRRPSRRADPDADEHDERLERRKRRRQAEEEAAPGTGRRHQAAAARGAVQVELPEPPAPTRHKRPKLAEAQGGDDAGGPVRLPATAEEVLDRATRTVFVGNLGAATTRKRLRQLFVIVALDPESKVPRRAALMTGQGRSTTREAVNGYIVFKEAQAVDAALALNMSLMDGRHVRVDRVAPPAGVAAAGQRLTLAPAQLDPKRTLYLGNVPFDADEEELITLFAPCGPIDAVRVPRDKFTSQGRGFALVCFTSGAGLGAAMALGPAAQIRGRQLRVARASAQKAAVAASSKRARVEAAAAVAEAKEMHRGGGGAHQQARGGPAAATAHVVAAEPQLARWQRRAALHGDAGDTAAEPKAGPAVRRGPAPWEGVHAATLGPRGEDGSAGGAAPKVKKPRWRDLGRTAGGIPLVAPIAILPNQQHGKGSGRAEAKRKAEKLKFRAAGVGKDGGHKRISSRKRPAVAARKALLARKKTG